MAKDDTDDGEISSGSSSSNAKETTIRNVQVRVTGVGGNNNKPVTGLSIFSRLGEKSVENTDNDLIIAKHIKPILKNTRKIVSSVVEECSYKLKIVHNIILVFCFFAFIIVLQLLSLRS